MLLLGGPPFLAASIYMSLGRIITALEAQKFSFISPRWMSIIYVTLDIGCIVSQFVGSIIPMSGDPDSIRLSRIILIAGLATQLVALSVFILTSWVVYRRIKQQSLPISVSWKRYFRAIEVATVVMIVRSTVRAIEFLEGEGGFVISHEIFIYLFDALLMFALMVILFVIHPGRLMKETKGAKGYREGSEEYIPI